MLADIAQTGKMVFLSSLITSVDSHMSACAPLCKVHYNYRIC